MTDQPPNSLFDTSSEAQARRGRLRHGDRTKLAKRYFADLYEAWEEQGPIVLSRAAFHDPMGFAKMIAGLMPQKLEIVHPTDGLTDERLAQLLEMAERIAALKAQGFSLADTNRLIDVTPEAGGGGPDRVGDAGGGVVSTLSPSAAAPEEAKLHNGLDTSPAADSTSERLIDEESTYAIQPPVGKPCPRSGEVEKRANLQKLTEPDVDPASLF